MNQSYLDLKKLWSNGFFEKWYFRLKWFVIPFEKIEATVPKEGKILDIGTGKGIFAAYLALSKKSREVIGIDNNSDKISVAIDKSKDINNISFVLDDINNVTPETYKAIIASDFFHHVDWENQLKILKTCYISLINGGQLIIKEIDKTPGIRYFCSYMADRLLYPKDTIYFRSRTDWRDTLSTIGFKVKDQPSNTLFGSTVLYICEKSS